MLGRSRCLERPSRRSGCRQRGRDSRLCGAAVVLNREVKVDALIGINHAVAVADVESSIVTPFDSSFEAPAMQKFASRAALVTVTKEKRALRSRSYDRRRQPSRCNFRPVPRLSSADASVAPAKSLFRVTTTPEIGAPVAQDVTVPLTSPMQQRPCTTGTCTTRCA